VTPATDTRTQTRSDRQRLAQDGEMAKRVESIDRVEDVKLLMATPIGRRQAYRLLHEGRRLPGQRISNTNGSLQSHELGRNDALIEFDEIIRFHCNDLWKEMLVENKHNANEQ